MQCPRVRQTCQEIDGDGKCKFAKKTRSIWKNVGPIHHCEPPHAHSPDVASGTVARRLRIDVHDNDNAWQRGPLWPHRWAQLYWKITVESGVGIGSSSCYRHSWITWGFVYSYKNTILTGSSLVSRSVLSPHTPCFMRKLFPVLYSQPRKPNTDAPAVMCVPAK